MIITKNKLSDEYYENVEDNKIKLLNKPGAIFQIDKDNK